MSTLLDAGLMHLPLPAAPRLFQACTGQRRSFLSERDAAAYDRGFRCWPAEPRFQPSPEWSGYVDRDAAEHEARLQRDLAGKL